MDNEAYSLDRELICEELRAADEVVDENVLVLGFEVLLEGVIGAINGLVGPV